jgi:hypothetical protein
MSMISKGHHRGHCQACGSVQVVRADIQWIAQHGYRVAGFGYFQGVCPGSRYKPLELERMLTDQIITSMRSDADKADERAQKLCNGERRPMTVRALDARGNPLYTKNADGKRVQQMKTWQEASSPERDAQVMYEIANAQGFACNARAQATDLALLATRVHGTALINRDAEELARVAVRKAKSAPIAGAYRTKAEQKRELENTSRQYEKLRRLIMDHYLKTNTSRNVQSPDFQVYNGLPFELHNWRAKHSAMVREVYPELEVTVNSIEMFVQHRNEIKARPVIK